MNFSGYLKIGFFFISLGGGGAALIIMSSDGFNRLNTKTYDVIIDDATGLSTNSKVYMAGVPVGKIKAINLEQDHALLTVVFLKDVDLRQNAVLSRKSSSILGTSILHLNPGDSYTPVLPVGSRIYSQPGAVDMSAAFGILQDLSTDLSKILKEFQERQMELLAISLETFNSLAKKFDDRSEAELLRISRILESTALITERLDSLLAASETDIQASFREIRLASETIRAITTDFYEGTTFTKLDGAIDELSLLASNASSVVSNTDSFISEAGLILSDAGNIVSKAAGLSVDFDSAVEYHILHSNTLGSASLRLEPRSKDRWYRVGVGQNPYVKVRSETNTSSLALDAEIARKFGLLTFRGGLYASKAGLGLDVVPFTWLALSGQVSDFSSTTAPNLQGQLTLYPFFDPASNKPWHWLYFKGGIFSAIRDDRDFFLGAGVRFTDEEIRGLVGLIPLSAAQ